MIVIAISGDIGWEVTANDIREQLNQAGGADVRVDINSPGGFISEGVEIFNLLKNYSGKVETRIVGFAASMASVIALAGDDITAEDTAIYMIHNAGTGVWGDHHWLRKTADVIEGLTDLLAKVYINQTGKTKAQINKLMDAETWFFGDELLTEGFVNRMIPSVNEKNKSSAIKSASAAFSLCQIRMKKDEVAQKDMEQAAAIFNSPFSSSVKGFKPIAGERLGAFLNRTINRMAGDDEDERGRLIRRMASAAGITENTVRQILNGSIVCPPIARLRAFAGVLDVSLQSIINAAEQDGCDYSEEEDSAEADNNGGCGGGT